MLTALMSNDLQMTITCDAPVMTMRSGDPLKSEIVESIQYIETQNVNEEKYSPSLVSSASNWVPTSGYASAWASTNVEDATYMDIHYQWAETENLSTLTSKKDSTLEAELIFHNYNGNAISNAWYSGNYTFNTNQPGAYQDTQAFDGQNEINFSIGCSKASELKAGVDYYWIALGNKTESTGCSAKVNFQRGHRVFNNLYEETWNIFADETVNVVPFTSWNTATNGRVYFGE